MQLPNIVGDYALSFVSVYRRQAEGAGTLVQHGMFRADDLEQVHGVLRSHTPLGRGSITRMESDVASFPRLQATQLHDGVLELLKRPVTSPLQRGEADTVIAAGFRPVDGQGPRVDDVFSWVVPSNAAGTAPFDDVLRAMDDVLGRPRA